MLLASVASGRHSLGLSIDIWICVEGQGWVVIRLGKGVGLGCYRSERRLRCRAGAASAFLAAQLRCGPEVVWGHAGGQGGMWGQRKRTREGAAREEKARRGVGGAAGGRPGEGSRTSVHHTRLKAAGLG